MGKMNELSLAQEEELYDQFVESQREDLREEGRKEILSRAEFQLDRLYWQYMTALQLEKADGVLAALNILRSPKF